MPLPKVLRRMNRSTTNKLVVKFAGRAGALALVAHTGRKSGRSYQTGSSQMRV